MISSAELLHLQFQIDGVNSNRYAFNLPFLRGSIDLKRRPQVTFFLGENGTGKSTLIEAQLFMSLARQGLEIKRYKETVALKSYANFIKDSDNHIRHLLK